MSKSESSLNPVNLFYSYSHKDEALRKELETHLAMLRREGQITSWHDSRIPAGEDWEGEISEHLNSADIILLLVSSDFLASDYCYEKEVTRAIARHRAKVARVIPIILRPCVWTKSQPLVNLKVLPTDAVPITRWADIDEAFLNVAEGISSVCKELQTSRLLVEKQPIEVQNTDVIDFPCDALVLKYAQAFHGADAAVATMLSDASTKELSLTPAPGDYTLVTGKGLPGPKHVLFVGVPDLYDFDYAEIRKFARHSMQILSNQMPDASRIAMTMHGIGYGLDEREAFSSQVAGLMDALKDGAVPTSLERVTIVERNQDRAERLRLILKEILPALETGDINRGTIDLPGSITEVGVHSDRKKHVFVAMPLGEDMEDIYIFGIQEPVNAAGFLCERVDMNTFTGDILARIKSRIETASLVIADLTGAHPNVYLEVGFAWGKNRPTLLISKMQDELKFDVRGQRCVIYKSISDLAKKLEAELGGLV